MREMTGGEAVYETLRSLGVQHVFGIVSVHNLPIYDAIERGGGITAVAVRHEQGAVHAADGYSRATVVGDDCWVAGTTDPSGEHLGDPAGQTRATMAIIERALTEAGFSLADVVRTRMYVTDAAHADAVASVHGEVFGEVRPASTLVVVAGLVVDLEKGKVIG